MTPRTRRLAVAAGAIAAFGVGIFFAVLLFREPSTPRHAPVAPAPANARAAAKPQPKADPAAVAAARMPAEDAVAQLFVIGVKGTVPSPGLMRTVRRHAWGGVILTGQNWSTRRGV